MAKAKNKKKTDRTPVAGSPANHRRALEVYTREIEEARMIAADFLSTALSSIHSLYASRSAAHLGLKNYDAALADADESIALRPDWARGYHRRGQALEGLLRFSEAHIAYARGLALDPTDSALASSVERISQRMSALPADNRAATSDSPEDDPFFAMTTWLQQGGAHFPKLTITQSQENHRSVYALSPIALRDILLFVPVSHIITRDVAIRSEIGKQITTSKLKLRSTHSYLAAYLLQERTKGTSSFWQPYIAILPSHFDNVPLFYTTTVLDMLQGSFVLDKLKSRTDNLRIEYENLKTHVDAFSDFSYEDFVWARVAVVTRIFGITTNGRKTDGLVPYADMLNHRRHRDLTDKDTNWEFDDNLNGFKIVAMRPIGQGKEVFDSYGRKCNSRFLLNYGFVLNGNEDDNEARFRLSLKPEHPCFDEKAVIFGHKLERGELRREFDVRADFGRSLHGEPRALSMFGFLRFVHASEAEYAKLQVATPTDVESIQPISIENEREVLKTILSYVESAISAFPTTLEEDREILATARYPAHCNEFNCVVMRAGEKHVLLSYLNLAKVCVPLLELPSKKLKRATAKFVHGNTHLDYYVTATLIPLIKDPSAKRP